MKVGLLSAAGRLQPFHGIHGQFEAIRSQMMLLAWTGL